MRACVVYESMFGNTAEVARAVARGLGEVPVIAVADADPADLAEMDLVVLGGPTHAFSMTRESTRRDAHRQGATYGDEGRGIRELLADLPAEVAPPVATFDTRVDKVRRLPGSAARAASRDLRRHHHAVVVDQQSFYVEDTPGPLLAGELERATSWGRQLGARLESTSRR